MNVRRTHDFFAKNDIVALKADKAKSPEVEQQLVELGNSQKAIPFYAIYAPGLDEPITFSGIITSGGVIKELRQFTQDKTGLATRQPKPVQPPVVTAAAASTNNPSRASPTGTTDDVRSAPPVQNGNPFKY